MNKVVLDYPETYILAIVQQGQTCIVTRNSSWKAKLLRLICDSVVSSVSFSSDWCHDNCQDELAFCVRSTLCPRHSTRLPIFPASRHSQPTPLAFSKNHECLKTAWWKDHSTSYEGLLTWLEGEPPKVRKTMIKHETFWRTGHEGEMSHSMGSYTSRGQTHTIHLASPTHTQRPWPLAPLNTLTFIHAWVHTLTYESCTQPASCTKCYWGARHESSLAAWPNVTFRKRSITSSQVPLNRNNEPLRVLQSFFSATLFHKHHSTGFDPCGEFLALCYVTDRQRGGRQDHPLVFMRESSWDGHVLSHAVLRVLTGTPLWCRDRCSICPQAHWSLTQRH